jgi:hypothetical protein
MNLWRGSCYLTILEGPADSSYDHEGGSALHLVHTGSGVLHAFAAATIVTCPGYSQGRDAAHASKEFHHFFYRTRLDINNCPRAFKLLIYHGHLDLVLGTFHFIPT